MLHARLKAGLAGALLLGAFAAPALAQDDLVARGEYLAKAGDCTACHTTKGGEAMAGGYVFKMPMGTIISSNITPSKTNGIGNWTEEQFARALREGVSADGRRLYPAMPYTSYSNITDDDMKALYAYFQQAVKPVDADPVRKTELDFPFNLPGEMAAWDLLYANGKPFTPDPKLNDQQNRGKYLVDGLAHCSTCHTPRNSMMAEESDKFLSGAVVDGWMASNITPDKNSGIGGWSEDEIATYLKTGHVEGKAQAGGPMADAVEHSFQHLTDEDTHAIAAYLKTIPAIATSKTAQPAYSYGKVSPVDWTQYEPGEGASDTNDYTDTSTTNGPLLYNVNCAACHGINGEGSDDGHFPSLTQNTAVGAETPDNLVMAIVDGIHRESADGNAVMPAFAPETQVIHTGLDNDQIAAVSNFVTAQFGRGDAGLTGSKVASIRAGAPLPFLLKNAAALAIIGFVIGALVIIALIFWVVKRSRKTA
ncbi:c-type cytochrome [Thioclava sp. GXIMD2076]|uniref:c-type cytochrome n=1 Tax=Thioclava sp. GXIMD2076 TaxID=3131931 RepID=UPI0030CB4CDB